MSLLTLGVVGVVAGSPLTLANADITIRLGERAMLSLKTSVNPKGIQPEILLAIVSMERIYYRHGHDLVITSLFDGKHGAHTLHQRDGICRAVDVRTKFLPNEIIPNMVQEIKDALGPQYDVVMEADHLHVEFDPKPEPTKQA